MPLSDFFRHLKSGADRVYLSTQNADVDFDGHPKLLTPPLAQLPGLPVRPRIMGALVPHAINLWLGASVDGTSSGLHHDFHDNLYVLLSGTKRFRLWPPSDAPRMYTHGTVEHVHANGRCDPCSSSRALRRSKCLLGVCTACSCVLMRSDMGVRWLRSCFRNASHADPAELREPSLAGSCTLGVRL